MMSNYYFLHQKVCIKLMKTKVKLKRQDSEIGLMI